MSVFIAGIGLDMSGLVGNTDETGEIAQQSAATLTGLRLLMTIMPMVLLIIAVWVFIRKFKLTDEVVEDNSRKLASRKRV